MKLLMSGEKMVLLEIRASTGVASDIHVHSHESVIYVISGKLSTTIDDHPFFLNPGDVCRHPSMTFHSVKALADTVFIEVKSPPPSMDSVMGWGGSP